MKASILDALIEEINRLEGLAHESKHDVTRDEIKASITEIKEHIEHCKKWNI